MNSNKADLIIETVHHKHNGQIDFVRAYQKRGSAYSDCLLVKRQELVKMLAKGMKVVTGQRIHLMGNSFSGLIPVSLFTMDNKSLIMTVGSTAGLKELAETPSF